MWRQSFKIGLSVLMFVLGVTQSAAQEFSLSFYTGWQTAPNSSVSGIDPSGAGRFDFSAGWEGDSFAMPPYYGLRGIWWRNERFGWTADFTHSKIYADEMTLGTEGRSGGFEVLEFSDGLNNLTFGAMWRWPEIWGDLTPYAGMSAGLVIPHVEVKTAKTAEKTFEYQIGGPSVGVVAGVSYEVNERWDVFGEYKGTYSQLDVDLRGGGQLKTDVVTNALNIGLAFKF